MNPKQAGPKARPFLLWRLEKWKMKMSKDASAI